MTITKIMQTRGGKDDGLRINTMIKSEKIRLVDADGAMIGVVTVREGLARAEAQGMDLVEISPNADPPVCKIMDSGKYKYELQKKKTAARKNQKIVEVKEIKIRPVTGENDYQVKLRAIRSFLEDGNKVKVSLRFMGREITHPELGERVMIRIRDEIAGLGKAEFGPKMEGRHMIMILAPEAAVVK